MEEPQPALGPSAAPRDPGAAGRLLGPAAPAGWGPGPGYPPYEDGASLLDVANVLLRRRRLVAGGTLVAALVTAVITLLVPDTYTATVVFVPEAPPAARVPSGLAGLANQFGVTLGAVASESPRFYV